MSRRHAAPLLALLLAAAARPVEAQQEKMPARWRLLPVVDPLVGGQFDLGLAVGAAYVRIAQPTRPWLTDGAASVILRYGTNGSRSLSLVMDAPGLRRGWRLLGLVRTERLLRTPYFGSRNEDRRSDSLVSLYGDIYYRYALLRSTLYAAVQHRVAGPVWLHVAAQARHYRTSEIRQRSLYGDDVAGSLIADTVRHNGLEARLGAMVDTRDDWIVPTRGLFLETVASSGWLIHDPGSRANYQRFMIGGREYVPLGEKTVLAMRQRLALSRDTLPFYLAWEQLTSWLPDDGVVGSRFVRLHRAGTRLASDDAIWSIDLRRRLVDIDVAPVPTRVWGIAFADLGLLWEPHTRPGAQQGQWTVGAGFRLQPTRASLIGIDLGMTDIGFNLSAVSYFAF